MWHEMGLADTGGRYLDSLMDELPIAKLLSKCLPFKALRMIPRMFRAVRIS
jgi:hypothetical protein